MTIATTDVTNSATTVFTSSGNNAITFASFCNIHSGAVDIDIHVVPNGESVANSTLVIKDLTINAGDTYQLYSGPEKLLLGNADIISCTANTASSVTAVVSSTTI